MDLSAVQSGGGGWPGACARAGLAALTVPFHLATATRAWLYDRGLRPVTRVPRAVVSVGNLTAGGTGKTPFVAWLVDVARRAGRRPAVLARGYGPRPAGAPLSDEGTLLAELAGDPLPQVEDPRRVRGAARLLADHPDVDLILLDDGFQHRALHRDADVVLLDATNPFGHGHLLPRGLLREPPRALRRADVVVVTRADLVGADALATLEDRVARLAPRALRARAVTRATGLRTLDGAARPLTELAGLPVVAWAGVGNPAAFEATLRGAGAEVVARRAAADHHAPAAADLAAARATARDRGARAVLVTRKDLVKLRALAPDPAGPPVLALDAVTEVGEGREALLRVVLGAGRR